MILLINFKQKVFEQNIIQAVKVTKPFVLFVRLSRNFSISNKKVLPGESARGTPPAMHHVHGVFCLNLIMSHKLLAKEDTVANSNISLPVIHYPVTYGF